jgi:hypothetical protein
MNSINKTINDEDTTDDVEFWIVIFQIVVSPLLMAPYLLVEADALYEKQVHFFQTDPLLVCSGFDTLQNLWYKSSVVTLLPFLIGVVLHYIMCDFTTLLLELIALYSIVQWLDASTPTNKDVLEKFYDQSSNAEEATILKHWYVLPRGNFLISFLCGTMRYYVRICYSISDGSYVMKDIESKVLYDHCRQLQVSNKKKNTNNEQSTTGTTIDICFDPNCPLSGYPKIQLLEDIHRSWSLRSWQGVCFITLWSYLVSASLSLNVDTVDDPTIDELVMAVIVIFVGPILMLPHAIILRRKQHDEFILNLYENGRGRIVDKIPSTYSDVANHET